MHTLEIHQLVPIEERKNYFKRFTITSSDGEVVKGIAFITERYIDDNLKDAAYPDNNGNVSNFLDTEIEKLSAKAIDVIKEEPRLIFANDKPNVYEFVVHNFKL